MITNLTIQFATLSDYLKKFLLDNQEHFNPSKVLALLHFEEFKFEDNEELQVFLDELKPDYFKDGISFEGTYGESWYVFDEEETLYEVKQAREDYIDSIKTEISRNFYEYVDWDQMAEDAIMDVYDVFPDATIERIRIALHGFPEGKWNISNPEYFLIVKEE